MPLIFIFFLTTAPVACLRECALSPSPPSTAYHPSVSSFAPLSLSLSLGRTQIPASLQPFIMTRQSFNLSRVSHLLSPPDRQAEEWAELVVTAAMHTRTHKLMHTHTPWEGRGGSGGAFRRGVGISKTEGRGQSVTKREAEEVGMEAADVSLCDVTKGDVAYSSCTLPIHSLFLNQNQKRIFCRVGSALTRSLLWLVR